jgi:integrase
MVIRVEQGKGAKGRLAVLSPRLLEVLRDYFRREQPGQFLFPSLDLCVNGYLLRSEIPT